MRPQAAASRAPTAAALAARPAPRRAGWVALRRLMLGAVRRAVPGALLGAILLLAPASPAGAEPPQPSQVGVRLGEHPGFARIVFDLPVGIQPSVEITSGHVAVVFPAGTRIASPNWMPPRVLGFAASNGRAEISVEPGAEISQAWPAGRLVLDVHGPHAAAAAAPEHAAPEHAAPEHAAPEHAAAEHVSPGHAGAGTPPLAAGSTAPADTPETAATPATPPPRPASGHGHARPDRRHQASPAAPATPSAEPPPAQSVKAPDTKAPGAPSPPPPSPTPATQSSSTQVPSTQGPATQVPVSQAPLAQAPSPTSPGAPASIPSGGAASEPGRSEPARPESGRPEPARPEPHRATPPPDAAAESAPAVPAPVTAEPLPPPMPGPRTAPVSLRVTALSQNADGMPGFAVPFDQHVAAAAFRRGPYAFIVFDQARPLDLGGLHADTVFGDATVAVLPEATVIRLPLAAGQGLTLAPAGERWTVRLNPLAIPPHPISPRLADGRLTFALEAPGAVVAVPDPDTGALLLVGTQRRPGQGLAAARRTPGFTLLPSWQGVALEPFADTLTLQPMQGGFALAASDGLSLQPQTGADAESAATNLTRRFDFPPLPTDALMRRLRTQIQSAAAAPPLARAPLRRLAAQTLISLGMGAEAQGLLDLAATDDPRAADDPEQVGLSAIAALLAGRPQDSEGLDDPRLAGTDEIALWRAARLAMAARASGEQASPEAAATFAATVPLALAYPAPLRARLLPLMAETMAAGGQAAAAKRLLGRVVGTEPGLGLSRAMLAEAQGNTAAALADYDQLALDTDRLASARAADRAVELRLATHALDAAGAAAAIEKQIDNWRGDRREYALRLRLAELRAQAGEWRGAFDMLRETAAAFPEEPATLGREKDLFSAFLAGAPGDHLSPLDFVAFVDENADLMPDGPAGDALAERLSDRLALLDLPVRAGTLLQKLIDHARTPQARASFGARLAELRLGNEDAGGARAALAATDAPGLPDALAERRALDAARAEARLGDVEPALAALSAFNSNAALSARAQILEDAKDWPRAVTALSDLVTHAVPVEGALDDTQRHLVLRLASAAAAAGDTAMLARLRAQVLPRVGAGADADMLRVLTEAPVTSVDDLARARAEEQSASSLAARMAQAAGPADAAKSAAPAGAGKPSPSR